MNEDFAAGASAARNKLARFLNEHGIHVESSSFGSPPKDKDFLEAVSEVVGSGAHKVVVFQWWNSTYYLPVSDSVVGELMKDPSREHRLFSATSPGGQNIFFLSGDDAGNVAVYKKQAWRRGDSQRLDTIIVRASAHQEMPELACPVCGVQKNSFGQEFKSDWAVTCHLAGKVEYGDKDHAAWVQTNAPNISQSARGWGLGDELFPAVRKALKTG